MRTKTLIGINLWVCENKQTKQRGWNRSHYRRYKTLKRKKGGLEGVWLICCLKADKRPVLFGLICFMSRKSGFSTYFVRRRFYITDLIPPYIFSSVQDAFLGKSKEYSLLPQCLHIWWRTIISLLQSWNWVQESLKNLSKVTEEGRRAKEYIKEFGW